VTKPFVVYASRKALAQAQRLDFGSVLENAVERAIGEGRHFGRIAGDRLVDLGGGFVARCATRDRTPAGRRRVLVIALERKRGYHPRTNGGLSE
jgi:hypothetical protein